MEDLPYVLAGLAKQIDNIDVRAEKVDHRQAYIYSHELQIWGLCNRRHCSIMEFLLLILCLCPSLMPGPKTIKKKTNSTPNKSQTQRLVLT